ncbi:MAG: hypothetical protein DRP78_06470, partial [Candidatus Omnitrophota bacterium]
CICHRIAGQGNLLFLGDGQQGLDLERAFFGAAYRDDERLMVRFAQKTRPTVEARFLSLPIGENGICLNTLADRMQVFFGLLNAVGKRSWEFNILNIGLPFLLRNSAYPENDFYVSKILDYVFAKDVRTKAAFLRLFYKRGNDYKTVINQQFRFLSDQEIKEVYEQKGLSVIYDLHKKAGGIDLNIERNLLEQMRVMNLGEVITLLISLKIAYGIDIAPKLRQALKEDNNFFHDKDLGDSVLFLSLLSGFSRDAYFKQRLEKEFLGQGVNWGETNIQEIKADFFKRREILLPFLAAGLSDRTDRNYKIRNVFANMKFFPDNKEMLKLLLNDYLANPDTYEFAVVKDTLKQVLKDKKALEYLRKEYSVEKLKSLLLRQGFGLRMLACFLLTYMDDKIQAFEVLLENHQERYQQSDFFLIKESVNELLKDEEASQYLAKKYFIDDNIESFLSRGNSILKIVACLRLESMDDKKQAVKLLIEHYEGDIDFFQEILENLLKHKDALEYFQNEYSFENIEHFFKYKIFNPGVCYAMLAYTKDQAKAIEMLLNDLSASVYDTNKFDYSLFEKLLENKDALEYLHVAYSFENIKILLEGGYYERKFACFILPYMEDKEEALKVLLKHYLADPNKYSFDEYNRSVKKLLKHKQALRYLQKEYFIQDIERLLRNQKSGIAKLGCLILPYTEDKAKAIDILLQNYKMYPMKYDFYLFQDTFKELLKSLDISEIVDLFLQNLDNLEIAGIILGVGMELSNTKSQGMDLQRFGIIKKEDFIAQAI